jgi:hypothetical protein
MPTEEKTSWKNPEPGPAPVNEDLVVKMKRTEKMDPLAGEKKLLRYTRAEQDKTRFLPRQNKTGGSRIEHQSLDSAQTENMKTARARNRILRQDSCLACALS